MSKVREAWRSLRAFLLLGVGLIAGVHYYLWARLVRDVGFPAATERALTWILFGLAVSIPVAVFTSRLSPRAWSVWWVTPVYLWIGTSFLLLLSVAVVDVLRIGLGGAGAGRSQAAARVGAFVAVAIGLGASAWAAREGRTVRVERVEVPLKKLPRGLDGLRIVQLSDVHVGPTTGRGFVERLVATVNALSPDVVAITGDLVDGAVEDLEPHVAPLADLASTYGTYFVTGNHEYHAGALAWCEHLGRLGIRVLHNEHVELGRDEDVIHLAGIDDYESARVDVGHRADLPRAVAGRDARRALILLAHQPKAAHEAARHGVDLQLSGHTHGGQLWPLGWLMRMAQPFVAGLDRLGETVVYVSRGTGSAGPPMRLGAPAEITQLVLRSA
jgi:predicted MPP superfamily phosphohydrolase